MIKIPYVFRVKNLLGRFCVVSVVCGLNWLFVGFFSASFYGWPSQPRAPALRSPMGAPAPPLPPSAALRSAVAFGLRGAACCVPAVFGLNCGRSAPALTASDIRPAGCADARPRAPLGICSCLILKGLILVIRGEILYICTSLPCKNSRCNEKITYRLSKKKIPSKMILILTKNDP